MLPPVLNELMNSPDSCSPDVGWSRQIGTRLRTLWLTKMIGTTLGMTWIAQALSATLCCVTTLRILPTRLLSTARWR